MIFISSFDEHRIWQALAQAHLKHYIESLPFGLDTIVADGGENFSAGQRQLLCLARCLLRKTKVSKAILDPRIE